MTVQSLLTVVRERWLLVVVPLVVAVLAAGLLWALRPPEYTATTRLFVSAANDSTSAAYEGAQLARERVPSYLELVTSTKVTGDVVRTLGLQESPADLATQITPTNAAESVLIDIAVTDGDPARAAAIANAVGAAFQAEVVQIEKRAAAQGIPPVSVSVVQPADVPTAPSSTGLPLTLVLGLLAGTAVGIGAAFTRHSLDRTVRSTDALRALVHAPLLGPIPYDRAYAARPLLTDELPNSPRTEAFRQLRTNLHFVDTGRPSKVLLVTSAAPLEGKTSVVCNLAISLAAAEYRVLVVEADLRRPQIGTFLGLEDTIGLSGVLSQDIPPSRAIERWWAGGFDVLAGGSAAATPGEVLAMKRLPEVVATLRPLYDVILLDSPAVLAVSDATIVSRVADGALLVCARGRTRRDQIAEAEEALAAVSAPVVGTVLTMDAPRRRDAVGQYATYYTAEPVGHRSSPSAPSPTIPESLASPRRFVPSPRPRKRPETSEAVTGPADGAVAEPMVGPASRNGFGHGTDT
ncbi:non-specific protein-tyrosine kinase [Actinomycetospora succinea]|uniref:Non-specific protein-tyrosine kinase n=1 Tax=Actinomycetospora succinea TaxID=663603 RepID=A0A4R6USS6_9PSEU|nr:polysaccharide biosynthesis tyrosine autokinase [Actinomycetospora succinea]TDQ48869.1 non-specific protein-tyrosine kinase [Actinomycetospora succinea]